MSSIPLAQKPAAMIDRHSLFFVHGLLLLALGAGMLFPAGADWLAGEPDAQVFLVSAAISITVGGLLVAAGHRQRLTLSRKAGFLLTTSAYISVSLFGALPFFLSNQNIPYVDALFETISGLTTTGATVLSGLDTMPPGLMLWRAILNWLGGLGVVAIALILMPFLEVGGMQLLRGPSGGDSADSLHGARRTGVAVVTVYVFLSTLCFVAYWIAGMSRFDAVVHAMSTMSTGGFSSHDASFAYFNAPLIQWVAIVFMFLAACPYAMFLRMAQGSLLAPLRDSQVRTLFMIGVGVSAALVIAFIRSHAFEGDKSVREIVFNVTSILTTTGFSSADFNLWGPFAGTLFMTLMFVGGCTGSASGGIKIMRYEIMIRVMALQVRRLLDPRAVVRLRYHRRQVSATVVLSITVLAFLYLASTLVIAGFLALIGVDPLSSFAGAAAAVGNVGPALGPVIGPSGDYGSLPDAAKLMLAAGMVMGRLEFFSVLVLFSTSFWRS